MIHSSNCLFCKNQIDKTIKTKNGIKVIPVCKAFPNGIPLDYYNKIDFNTERECSNGFNFTPQDRVKKIIETEKK